MVRIDKNMMIGKLAEAYGNALPTRKIYRNEMPQKGWQVVFTRDWDHHNSIFQRINNDDD